MDPIETICANSYRNFHTRGFDYLCLSRTPELTRKVYFFEGDLHDLPELVIPHDHRYPFVTTVLSGAVKNKTYTHVPLDRIHPSNRNAWEDLTEPYDHFEYLTPLNGGDGFRWVGETRLKPNDGRGAAWHKTRGQHWRSCETTVHTLDIRCEGTVILLEQLADVVPIGQATNAYRKAGDPTPPSLDGLYDRMTPDHARIRISQFLDHCVTNR